MLYSERNGLVKFVKLPFGWRLRFLESYSDI